MSELKVGVVGLGSMGVRHAEAYRRLPGVRLAAVATRSEERRQAAAAEWGVEAYADYRALVGRVDAVTVATPTYLHAEIAEHLLRAGIHVLVEKPIAVTEHEALRLQAAAAAAGVTLMVGHVERFNPAFIRLTGALNAARAGGEPLYVRAYRMGPYDGRIQDVCVVLDLMIHDIDLALAVTGGRAWRIRHALGMNVVTDRTDVAMVEGEISAPGRAPARLHLLASRVNETKRRLFEVRTGRFLGRADLLEQRVWVAQGADWRELPVERQSALELQLAHFVACVRCGTPPAVTGATGTTALKFCLDVVEAIQNTAVRRAE